MLYIIIILFLLYFPVAPTPTEHSEEQHEHHIVLRPSDVLHSEYRAPTYRTALSVTVAAAAHFMLFAVISVIFLARSEHQARVWAAWMGVMGMGLAAAQYIPQLWVTWRIKVVAPVLC